MTVHCKSKDDDLGFHVVPIKGNYGFKFKPNFWDTTQFFCSFKWGTEFHYFDIYIYERDSRLCADNECMWSIRPNGPCRWDSTFRSYLCHEWNKNN
ncbi:unnamed protein product [Prunus armeniaca]|uniref:S-protein homolog n=1 Tax=Prunus armeniaca TaxID=36596 RepID=A0A6J5YE52_PRUAR|nr:unnamed protein product [Prunus armeniaca]